ncbi:helix-turn-helix domain-containing protein [Streptomyces somaliensis]|uniref:helix-turn-helix domain-containing protein n=1 Tax=Streptomyces somaliensis TaxID=78355 RepID=UPI0020CCD221|nr:helix-turn-helix domain-containing protein [Streptomyces somaliensis]MCP9946788.1 helix-turn-helix domain-containing protein [Streptomyces somaliensis]
MPRPMLSPREAAAACGVSRTTIRRRREDGAFPGAVQDERRGWLIPVEDLLAAGFRLNAPAPPDPDPAETSGAAGVDGGQGVPGDVAALQAALERERLEHRLALAEERHGRELAEERERGLRARVEAQERHIDSLEESLRALLPAPERTAVEAAGASGGGVGVSVPAQQGQTGPSGPPVESSASTAGGPQAGLAGPGTGPGGVRRCGSGGAPAVVGRTAPLSGMPGGTTVRTTRKGRHPTGCRPFRMYRGGQVVCCSGS